MSKVNSKRSYVMTNSGRIPYSIGYMAQTLISAGLSEKKAYRDAYSISLIVNDMHVDEFTSEEIMDITFKWYMDKDPNFASRIKYLDDKLQAFSPMVILLGGVTGVGKSTLAQLLGTTLGLKTILGTDLLREILRVTISPNLMPMLHTSSYVAYKTLDTSFLPAKSKSVFGFEEQARAVSVSIESAIEQAIRDKELVIIEGVHLVPGILKKRFLANKVVLFVMLTLMNEDTHRSRLTIRETKSESRSESYLQYFENIRKIQNYLVNQANKEGVPIIDLENDEDALKILINLVWDWKLSQLEDEVEE